ncbi:hypothetical protein CK203_055875 [Vitis vinifera]|uniref:DUF4283 domain-containing protein n=1 Tax=Vitis vinifera TaxID=29760 RepID=A0A438GP81_VITVI|nr:hypothetical protein CK203_055875 [Vitis vinifera]
MCLKKFEGVKEKHSISSDIFLEDGRKRARRERESGGDEGDESVTKRRKRERNSFVVESKIFEIDAEEKRGKIQVAIWEKKKGISSWVRLGSASLGFLLESLDHCIKDGKGGKWERDWKENGRSYSLVRNENKAGLFLRLGVVDLEKKRHSIIIPKGRGEKGGWVTMAEKLHKWEVSWEEGAQAVRVGGGNLFWKDRTRKW